MNDVEVNLEKKIPKILKKAIDFFLGGVYCSCYQEASEGLLKEVIFMEV